MNGRIKREEKSTNSNLPVIGKIKVGEIVKNAQGKEYPRSLDYFRATGKYASKFYDVYGEEPSKIEVIFASDDLQAVCNETYELRGSDGRLHGRGDGETFKIWDRQSESYVTYRKDDHRGIIKKAPKNCGSRKGWEATLTLRFIIPKISGVMGVWQLTTKGAASSIPGIIKAYDTVLHMAGTVQMIPFDLQVEMVTSQKPGSASKFPVIQLVPNIDTDNMETVRNYISEGGSILGVRKLLNGEQTDEPKAIEGEVPEDDEKPWLDETNKKQWMNAEEKIKNGEIEPKDLYKYYKVSKLNMEYFETLAADRMAEIDEEFDKSKLSPDMEAYVEEYPDLPF